MTIRPKLNSGRFYRNERLKKRLLIQQLFNSGKQIKSFPILLFYLPGKKENLPYHQALFSVPKKHFKSSVVRNKIKRRIREAYRLHKHRLYNKSNDLPFLLGYVYISKNIHTYKDIESKVLKTIQYLEKNQNTTDYEAEN